jgi:hypothetical protein
MLVLNHCEALGLLTTTGAGVEVGVTGGGGTTG